MAEDVYRVEIRNNVDGQMRALHADLIFRDESPFVVLSWETRNGESIPSVIEGINAEHLHKQDSTSPLVPHYLYHGRVDGLHARR